jgi:putative transposase
MKSLWQSLLMLLAQATDRELARVVQYLKVENEILRGKLPARVRVTPRERQRLLRFGKPLGAAIRQVISIVSPRTFLRWLRGESSPRRERRLGRPPTATEIGVLVLRLARENSWGYTRIHGELKKLGLASISRSTVVNILKAEGIETGPQRGEGTWHDFVQRQTATLWACDFFTAKIWTLKGLVACFGLFFIHVSSRRVCLAGLTTNPTRAWVAERARDFCRHVASLPVQPTHLIRDLDGKFGADFDAALQAHGMEVVRVGPRKPLLNSIAERWVKTVKSECLNQFLIFGEAHLRYLLGEFVDGWYNGTRPHQGLGNVPLAEGYVPPAAQTSARAKEVACERRLGGLLKHYHLRAAA